jgi:hypothetical protein
MKLATALEIVSIMDVRSSMMETTDKLDGVGISASDVLLIKGAIAEWIDNGENISNLENAYVDALVSVYSQEELDALLAFYSSEHGNQVMRKAPRMLEQMQRHVMQAVYDITNKLLG